MYVCLGVKNRMKSQLTGRKTGKKKRIKGNQKKKGYTIFINNLLCLFVNKGDGLLADLGFSLCRCIRTVQ